MAGTAYKFTDQTITDAFLEACDLGMSVKTCCDYAGISERTFHNWRNDAESIEESPYADFIKEVSRRQATVKMKYSKIIMDAAKKDEKTGWKAAVEYLKAAYPHEYGSKVKIQDVTVSGQAKIESKEKVPWTEMFHKYVGSLVQHKDNLLIDLLLKFVDYGILDISALASREEMEERFRKAKLLHSQINLKERNGMDAFPKSKLPESNVQEAELVSTE